MVIDHIKIPFRVLERDVYLMHTSILSVDFLVIYLSLKPA